MANLPNAIASSGDNASVNTEIQEREEIAKLQTRLRQALQKKVEKAEAEVGGQSFTAREMANGVFPFQEYNNLHAALASSTATVPGNNFKERQNEAEIAVKTAKFEDTQEAIGDFKKGLTGAAVAVGAFISALNNMQAAQAAGAINANNLEAQFGFAAKGLKLGDERTNRIRDSMQSGKPLAGNVSPVQLGQLWATANEARAKSALTGEMVNVDELEKIFDDPSLSFEDKMAAASQPMVPQVEKWKRTRGQGSPDSTTSLAAHTLAKQAATAAQGNKGGQIPGNDVNQVEAELTAEEQRGGWFASFGPTRWAKKQLSLDEMKFRRRNATENIQNSGSSFASANNENLGGMSRSDDAFTEIQIEEARKAHAEHMRKLDKMIPIPSSGGGL